MSKPTKLPPTDTSRYDSKLQNTINKTTVENIKKSNAAMRDELNAETRISNMTNAQTGSKIAKLQEKGVHYAKQIEIEAKKLSDLERQIEIVQSSVTEKRANIAKIDGNASDSLGKQIKQSERKLDKTLTKHNEILAENRQLKEEIDHLRRERVTFDKIYKKLEVELQEKKKNLLDVFKASEKAKERKKAIEDQIKNLTLRVKKEEGNIEREFQDVFKGVDEKSVIDKIDNTQMNITIQKSGLPKDIGQITNKNLLLDESQDQSRMSMRKTGKSVDRKHKNSEFQPGKTPQEEVEEYNAVFEILKKKTHKNDINEILALYHDYEQQNYSLYGQIGLLSDEKDTLEKQIAQIKEDITKLTQSQQRENDDNIAENKAQKIQELRDEIEESDSHHRVLENKQKELNQTIETLKTSIPIIFESLGCKPEDYSNELLDSTTVTEGNILSFLAIIERKTNEILQMSQIALNKAESTSRATVIDDKFKKLNEESHVFGGTNFPEKELLGDLQAAPEKAEMQTAKDFQDYAKEKVKTLLDKKSAKAGK